MTWKQFVRRFNEMMADTSTTPLGATDLEAWREQQKKITEQRLQEELEKRELVEHWFEQDTYVNGSWLKRAWMRLQFIFLDIKGEKHHSKIPDYVIQEMARCLLPDLIAFYESKEGMAAFNQWKAEQDAKKKEQSKVA
jgi:hypothetical protein